MAALAVALSHLVSFSASVGFLGLGTIGVEVFFVISGFIMVHITNDREQRPLDFFLHRVVRVVPLYWLLTLAIFVLAWAAPQLLKSTRADLVDLIKSLMFIPYVKHGSTLQPLLFQGWTLNFEMVFYLLFAGALMLRKQVERVIAVSAVIVMAVIAGTTLPQLIGPLDPVAMFYASPLTLCFALGMGLGLVYPRITDGLVWLALALFGFLQLAEWTGLLGEGGIYHVRIAFAFAVVTAGLALEQRGWVLSWQPLQLLGAASYSLYLVHPFAAIATEKLARHFGLLNGMSLLASLAFATTAMIVAGLLLYRWVEMPLLQAGRRLLR